MSDDLTPDEILVLREYRRTRELGHADGGASFEWSTKDGKLVKLWSTTKTDIAKALSETQGRARLRE